MASRCVDRVALVTGAGRGIGRAIAVRLAAEGAAVVVNDLDPEVVGGTVAEILGADARAISVAGSVADDDVCRAMVGAAEETFGGLDFLVNNAGLTADRLSTPGRFSPSRRAVEGAP